MIPEDELVVLERGMRSDFWALMVEKFQPRRQKLLQRLKSSTATTLDRDRFAEQLAMLDELLEWPSVRVNALTTKLKESK